MKVVMKPISVLSLFDKSGKIQPISFITTEDGNNIKIHIDKVLSSFDEKVAGQKVRYFQCQSIVNDRLIIVVLRYDIATVKWYLYKA